MAILNEWREKFWSVKSSRLNLVAILERMQAKVFVYQTFATSLTGVKFVTAKTFQSMVTKVPHIKQAPHIKPSIQHTFALGDLIWITTSLSSSLTKTKQKLLACESRGSYM